MPAYIYLLLFSDYWNNVAKYFKYLPAALRLLCIEPWAKINHFSPILFFWSGNFTTAIGKKTKIRIVKKQTLECIFNCPLMKAKGRGSTEIAFFFATNGTSATCSSFENFNLHTSMFFTKIRSVLDTISKYYL